MAATTPNQAATTAAPKPKKQRVSPEAQRQWVIDHLQPSDAHLKYVRYMKDRGTPCTAVALTRPDAASYVVRFPAEDKERELNRKVTMEMARYASAANEKATAAAKAVAARLEGQQCCYHLLVYGQLGDPSIKRWAYGVTTAPTPAQVTDPAFFRPLPTHLKRVFHAAMGKLKLDLTADPTLDPRFQPGGLKFTVPRALDASSSSSSSDSDDLKREETFDMCIDGFFITDKLVQSKYKKEGPGAIKMEDDANAEINDAEEEEKEEEAEEGEIVTPPKKKARVRKLKQQAAAPVEAEKEAEINDDPMDEDANEEEEPVAQPIVEKEEEEQEPLVKKATKKKRESKKKAETNDASQTDGPDVAAVAAATTTTTTQVNLPSWEVRQQGARNFLSLVGEEALNSYIRSPLQPLDMETKQFPCFYPPNFTSPIQECKAFLTAVQDSEAQDVPVDVKPLLDACLMTVQDCDWFTLNFLTLQREMAGGLTTVSIDNFLTTVRTNKGNPRVDTLTHAAELLQKAGMLEHHLVTEHPHMIRNMRVLRAAAYVSKKLYQFQVLPQGAPSPPVRSVLNGQLIPAGTACYALDMLDPRVDEETEGAQLTTEPVIRFFAQRFMTPAALDREPENMAQLDLDLLASLPAARIKKTLSSSNGGVGSKPRQPKKKKQQQQQQPPPMVATTTPANAEPDKMDVDAGGGEKQPDEAQSQTSLAPTVKKPRKKKEPVVGVTTTATAAEEKEKEPKAKKQKTAKATTAPAKAGIIVGAHIHPPLSEMTLPFIGQLPAAWRQHTSVDAPLLDASPLFLSLLRTAFNGKASDLDGMVQRVLAAPVTKQVVVAAIQAEKTAHPQYQSGWVFVLCSLTTQFLLPPASQVPPASHPVPLILAPERAKSSYYSALPYLCAMGQNIGKEDRPKYQVSLTAPFTQEHLAVARVLFAPLTRDPSA